MKRFVVLAAAVVAFGTGSPHADVSPAAYAIVTAGQKAFTLDVRDARGQLVRTVESSSAVEDPGWSPDGSMLAWVGDAGLEVERTDGTGERVVMSASHTCSDCAPLDYAWSPDGTRLAVGGAGPETDRAAVVSLATSVTQYIEPARPFTSYGVLGWTPDDSVVLVAGRDILVASADGARSRVAYHFGDERCSQCSAWALSPDGRAVAGVRVVRGNRPALVVISLRTGKALIVHGVGWTSSGAPAWSPSSRTVALAPIYGQAFTLPVTGGRRHLLGVHAMAVRWTRTGDLLLLRGERKTEVWVSHNGARAAFAFRLPAIVEIDRR